MGEARLVEILESVCKGKDEKCFAFLSDHEETIEDWWAELADGDVAGLETFLCVESSKVCCAAGAWGSGCAKCPGGKTLCNGHGSCNGDGLRTGSGKCTCDDGWSGKKCNKCKNGFYLAATPSPAEDVQSCRKCHESCSGCFGPGAESCDKCKPGFAKDGAGPCVEVDECAAEKNPCDAASAAAVVAGNPAQFCKNTPGSFECLSCHAACGAAEGQLVGVGVCSGPAAADCSGVCTDGYELFAAGSGGCKDVDECAAGHECSAGTVCLNKDGGVECATCDSSCSSEGCTAAGPGGCTSCKSGFEMKRNKCENVDECKAFPCQGAEDCVDTEGSYECKCNGPNKADAVDGSCIRPEKYRQMHEVTDEQSNAQAARRLALQDYSKGFHSGTAEVGSSDLASKGVKVDFPADMFQKAPAIATLKGNGICCGDTFNFTYSSLTKTGFTILAVRSDCQSGWGQKVKVDWEVVDSAAALLETRTAELVRPPASDSGSAGLGLEIVEDLKGNGDANGVRVRVTAGGLAEASGNVVDGDKIISVNGVPMRAASYDTVVAALRGSGSSDNVVLVLTPDASSLPVVKAAAGDSSGLAEPAAKDEL